jgi:hypothetical protein
VNASEDAPSVEATVDQRGFVERAAKGDHDAFGHSPDQRAVDIVAAGAEGAWSALPADRRALAGSGAGVSLPASEQQPPLDA